jgi:hypothetical protein
MGSTVEIKGEIQKATGEIQGRFRGDTRRYWGNTGREGIQDIRERNSVSRGRY